MENVQASLVRARQRWMRHRKRPERWSRLRPPPPPLHLGWVMVENAMWVFQKKRVLNVWSIDVYGENSIKHGWLNGVPPFTETQVWWYQLIDDLSKVNGQWPAAMACYHGQNRNFNGLFFQLNVAVGIGYYGPGTYYLQNDWCVRPWAYSSNRAGGLLLYVQRIPFWDITLFSGGLLAAYLFTWFGPFMADFGITQESSTSRNVHTYDRVSEFMIMEAKKRFSLGQPKQVRSCTFPRWSHVAEGEVRSAKSRTGSI